MFEWLPPIIRPAVEVLIILMAISAVFSLLGYQELILRECRKIKANQMSQMKGPQVVRGSGDMTIGQWLNRHAAQRTDETTKSTKGHEDENDRPDAS